MATQFDRNRTPTGVYKPGRIRDENLQRILTAAEAEFVARGYRGATIQAIADRAGLPKANVHYYFRSKANLYRSVLDDIVALWNVQFEQINADDDPAVALDGFIREKLRLSFTHRRASKLFAMEIISGAPHLDNYIAANVRKWVRSRARVIQSWMDRGLMAPGDPVQLIFLIWASTQHYANFDTQVLGVMNRRDYDKKSMARISDFLSTTILRGCGLEPPKQSV